MQLSFIHLLALLAVPVAVSACEGECIVGITNAFVGNYTTIFQAILASTAKQINELIPHASPRRCLSHLSPILDSYRKGSYPGMETAIFPSYFHGKCQRDGVEPAGCPNPDCPVVCGTPGSLVHFYPKLRYIAFNQTRHFCRSLTTPGSTSYEQVEKAVLADASGPTARTLRVYPRSSFPSIPDDTSSSDIYTTDSPLGEKRSENIKAQLREILTAMPLLLEAACDSSGTRHTNRLSACNWEVEMKKYILSFP